MSESPGTEPQAPAPRVRDMPAPRKSTGVFGPAMRFVFTWPYRAILAGLYRAGVRPWQLTVASLVANVVVGWLLLTGRRFLPGALLIPAGLFDVFDGAVARLRGEDRRAGAFLDSVLDRVGGGAGRRSPDHHHHVAARPGPHGRPHGRSGLVRGAGRHLPLRGGGLSAERRLASPRASPEG